LPKYNIKFIVYVTEFKTLWIRSYLDDVTCCSFIIVLFKGSEAGKRDL